MKKLTELRTIWPNERKDFSNWLANEENLKMLGEAVGMEIVLEERESSVGDFNVDLFATEEITKRKIVIENQIETTNHDHLGKIITYAAGKEAEVIIWLVKHARDEHKEAIAWLNSHTDSNIGFFLIEVELWQINDSPYAPKFNVVERPNDWAKSIKSLQSLSVAKQLQFDFWNDFINYAFSTPDFAKTFSKRKVQPQYWYDLSIGHSDYHLGLIADTQKKRIGANIYINNNKELFAQFKKNKEEIEKEFGDKLEWIEANKDCRILASKKGDIRNKDNNQELFDWLIETSFKLKKITDKYYNI